MNPFTALLERLRTLRTSRAAEVGAAYWRVAEEIARGREPKVREAELLEAMEALGKTENDLLEDARLLSELAQHEAAAKRYDAAREACTKTTEAAAADEAKAQQLRDEATELLRKAELARHHASAAVSAAERAAADAMTVRRKLGARGHSAAGAIAAASDEGNRVASQRSMLEQQLQRARAELANGEQRLAEIEARSEDRRAPLEGDGFARWLPQQRALVARLERQLAELEGNRVEETATA